MNPDEDPGWGTSWSALLMLVPGGARYYVRRQQQEGQDGLRGLRALYLAFVIALVIYGMVLLLIGGGEETGPVLPWALGLVALGVVELVAVRLIERPLNCDDDAALAGSYRTLFFLRLAFAQSVALFGFVLVFTVGPVWLYFLGLVFTTVGFARLAPTRANLQADQELLVQQGCGRSLVAALRSNPARPG